MEDSAEEQGDTRLKSLTAMVCSALAAIGLYGCDLALSDLKPGVSTGYEVRDRMGPPTMEWRNEDGSLTWEYARTPAGTVNYMIHIGADNILRSIEQVLTEENFARVRPGMTRDEIRHLLGKPAHVTRLDLKRQEVWDWKYKNPFPNIDTYFNVHFDQSGRVVETSRHEDPKN